MNSIQTNTFTKGMNLDTDINFIPNTQYRYAENVRIITDAEGTTGVMLNIEGVEEKISLDGDILAVTTYKDHLVILSKVDNINNIIIYNTNTLQLINKIVANFGYTTKDVKLIVNVEAEDNIKLYIICPNHNVRVLLLTDDYISNETNILEEYPGIADIVPDAALSAPQFFEFGTGYLNTCSVQYCYLLFNVRGNKTTISPCSEIIYVTEDEPTADKNITTNKSVKVKINVESQFYTSCRLYRITYVDATELPTVDIITEFSINENTKPFIYEDKGSNLSKTTLDEIAQERLNIIASTAESMGNRLFLANVSDSTWDVINYDTRSYRFNKDSNVAKIETSSGDNLSIKTEDDMKAVPEDHDCINPFNALKSSELNISNKFAYMADGVTFGGSGLNIDFNFTTTIVPLDTICYIDDNGFIKEDDINKYPNINGPLYYSSSSKALYMRDEIYRFGIMFYNKKGHTSPVHWIADIRIPDMIDMPSYLIIQGYGSNQETILAGLNLGIHFFVKNLDILKEQGVVGYEIVRCERTKDDRTIVMQGVLSSTNTVEYNIFNEKYQQYSGENEVRPTIPLSMSSTLRLSDENATVLGNRIGTREDYFVLISPEIDNSVDEALVDTIKDCYVSVQGWLRNCATPTSLSYDNDLVIKRLYITPYYSEDAWENNTLSNGTFPGIQLSSGGNTLYLCVRGSTYKILTYINTLLSKKYLFHKRNAESDIITTYPFDLSIENRSVINANILTQIQYQDLIPYYQSIDDAMYINFSSSHTPTEDGLYGDEYGRFGYFGKCMVVKLDSTKTGILFNMLDSADRVNLTDSELNNPLMNYFKTNHDSISDLPLVNLKRNIIPYGGNTHASRSNSIYISTHSYSEISSENTATSDVFGGDTYLGILDHKTNSVFPNPNVDQEYISYNMLNIADYIPFETGINLQLAGGENTSKSINTTKANVYLSPTIEGGTMGDLNVQTRPYNEYNDAYSVLSYARSYVTKGVYDEIGTKYPNRILVSQLKINGEIYDNWTDFKVADYLDVDNEYGPITNLKKFKDRLVYFQDSAVGIASVNERSLITDNNIGLLTLGTGGILVRYDYLTNKNGTSIINDNSIVDSYYQLYWHDFDKKVLCSYSNQVHNLSVEKTVQSYLNNKSSQVHASYYDPKYSEVRFNYDDKVLVYNELLQQFTAFYTYNSDFYAGFSDSFFYVKNNKIAKDSENSLNGVTAKLTVIINKDAVVTKTFDNVFMQGEFESIQEMFKEVVFRTKSQVGTILSDENNDYQIDYREDTYRFAIGRLNENKDEMSFAGRMKGKYLICDYTFDCSNHNFILPNILTTYRQSLV